MTKLGGNEDFDIGDPERRFTEQPFEPARETPAPVTPTKVPEPVR
jgi:hypothetical protein